MPTFHSVARTLSRKSMTVLPVVGGASDVSRAEVAEGTRTFELDPAFAWCVGAKADERQDENRRIKRARSYRLKMGLPQLRVCPSQACDNSPRMVASADCISGGKATREREMW